MLAGPDCLKKGNPDVPDASRDAERSLVAFCTGHHTVRKRVTGPGRVAELARLLDEPEDRMPWPGERIGLAYDAASLFVQAVRENLDRNRVRNPDGSAPSTAPEHRVHRAAVAQELREPNTFRGATGPIDFAESRSGRTRPLAILTIADIYDLDQVPTCTYEITMPAGESVEPPRGTSDC